MVQIMTRSRYRQVLDAVTKIMLQTHKNPSILLMSPADVTEIARDQVTNELATWEQRNPVPFDRMKGGMKLLGIDLTSDPDVKAGSLWIDGHLVHLSQESE